MIDRYTKIVLSVIAVALSTIAIQNVVTPAQAGVDSCGSPHSPCYVASSPKDPMYIASDPNNLIYVGTAPDLPLAVRVAH